MVAVFAAAPAFAQTTPSLADLARQVEKERAAARKAVKSFTNADLSPDPRAEVTPPAAPAEPPAFVSQATGVAVTAEQMVENSQAIVEQNKQNMGESYWRTRATSLRAQLTKARDALGELSTAPPPRTEGLRLVAAKQLERAKKTLADAEQRWQAFEESAGFAKVPPAWLEAQP
jgi:mevalonate kinase